jgi:hypothetical protein
VPNLYGVANAPGLPTFATLIGAANITLPAGVETAIITSPPLVAPSAGFFYPLIFGYSVVTQGAVGAGGATWFARIGNGADFLSISFPGFLLPANASVALPLLGAGAASEVPWRSPGSTITISWNISSGAATCYYPFSTVYFVLLRAPDQ